jgi:hypothetical protein
MPRLIGWQRCASCRLMQRACWTTVCDGPGECGWCGEMAAWPVGAQVLAKELYPAGHVEQVLSEVIEERTFRLAHS